jgi:choice-of-anchor B domain-containing protein
MKKKSVNLLCAIFILFVIIAPVNAQYVPGVNNNVTLLSHINSYQRYSNIWGYVDSLGNEYAIIGHNAGTSFYKITDPLNPVEVAMIPGTTSQGTVWREIKTYNKYFYVVSEHTSPNSLSGLQIIDISCLPDSVRYVGRYLWPGVTENNARAHTVTVDNQGYLYIHGGTVTSGGSGNNGGIRILSLADPENPVPVSTFDPRYVHDTFIQDSILFASNIYEGGHIDVINISDRSNPQLMFSHIYPNGYSHNSWTTEDKNYLVSTDEQNGLTVKIFDISVLWDNDPNNNEEIKLVGQYLSNQGTIAHEPRVRGNYVFISHYGEGVRVLDISNPVNPIEVGYYDTPNDWGVWPFFPSGNFVVSDIQAGLYVLRFDSLNAGGIEGVVTDLYSNQPLSNVRMRFVEADKIIFTDQAGSFSFRTNEGNHTIILSRSGYTTDTITVNFPAGGNIVQNFTLENNLARVSVSVDSISVLMNVDSVTEMNFTITNSGTGGILHYTLDDSDLSWLSLSPDSGNLSVGATDTITATFDSHNLDGNSQYSGYIVITSNDPTQSVKSLPVFLTTQDPLDLYDINDKPVTFNLGQNYPNPFNPVTVIPFNIPEAGSVKLEVYDILGQEIITLVNKEFPAGKYEISWNGKDANGLQAVSGVYF